LRSMSISYQNLGDVLREIRTARAKAPASPPPPGGPRQPPPSRGWWSSFFRRGQRSNAAGSEPSGSDPSGSQPSGSQQTGPDHAEYLGLRWLQAAPQPGLVAATLTSAELAEAARMHRLPPDEQVQQLRSGFAGREIQEAFVLPTDLRP